MDQQDTQIAIKTETEEKRAHNVELLIQTFVELSDSLVDEFDIIDLLSTLSDRCVELFGAAAAGILLADADNKLRVISASSENVRLLEIFQLQNDEGPCLVCFETGERVYVDDLKSESRWPIFAPEALRSGYKSVYALPLRLRNEVLGALNLFRTDTGPMPSEDLRAAQALADVSTVAILQEQSSRQAVDRVSHLQHALDSRVVIEQAKGMVAESTSCDLDEAFAKLRNHSRSNNILLTDVARGVVLGEISINELVSLK